MRLIPLLVALAAASLLVPQVSAEPAARAENSVPSVSPTTIVTVTEAKPAADNASPDVAAPAKVVVTPVAAPRKPAAPTLNVSIDLAAQRMTLSYGGQAKESWPISSGRAGFETPRGVFRPQWAAKMWFSRKYDNAPMPHAVFFNGGVAVHATQATRLLGQPASHGCVRLSPANAQRFYTLVHQHGYKSTRIAVHGTPPAPRVAQRPQIPAGRSVVDPRIAMGSPWKQPAMGPARIAGREPMGQPVRRTPNGVVYLPPGSPYQGRSSFVMNGITYVRVR